MKLTGSLVFLGVLVGAYGAVLNSRNQDNEFEDAMRIHYRIWGENPWDYPGNPPPIFPPDDFLRYSQIGHWWNQEKPWENPSRALRDALVGNKDDDADEYRIWGKFPWERPGNPPPFLPPADTRTFSQIGRWGNQDVNGERTGSFLRPLLAENKDETTDRVPSVGEISVGAPSKSATFRATARHSDVLTDRPMVESRGDWRTTYQAFKRVI
ncbi:uncharacterized protein LOC119441694 isoform X3 [Dermacentor silvarum]|uniref:uncharacterized protein LOC119441694 isoform X3 n=1 Tax=Dermacentor silvarum TaxID=543639 RepID=UPI00189888CF|nr:uncharacterized protein LOC119441694 isoform X3 [Dermacentor silvarum]